MNKRDGRKLSHATLEELRVRAVMRVQEGESPESVIRALGMSRSCIYEWMAAYRAGGLDALKAKKLLGRPKKVSAQDIQWLYQTIVQGNPRQHRFEFALWTLRIIQRLLAKERGITLSLASVWRLLRQMGLTCHRPLFKAMQQDPKAVRYWLRHTYPRIRALAKSVGARIFFGDEAGVRSDFHAGTTWAPKGETPVVEANGQRFGWNMISAVSAKGEMRFMLVDRTIRAQEFIAFLRRLMTDLPYKVFLIVDGHGIHRSRLVKEFVVSTEGRLALFYLPGYSPELNPDEFVWNDLKNHVVGKTFIADKHTMHQVILRGLRRLQRTPEKIRSYFQAEHTCYAA
jgi:transposase